MPHAVRSSQAPLLPYEAHLYVAQTVLQRRRPQVNEGALSAKCFPRTYVLTAGHNLFRDLAATPRYRRTLSVSMRGAARNEQTRARRNKFPPGSVAASYKIKARKASSTTRRELSAQQLRAGHGRAREGQLGTMVEPQLLFALLRRRSRPSDQTVSRHRVSYHIS